jgi:hypothetical protein
VLFDGLRCMDILGICASVKNGQGWVYFGFCFDIPSIGFAISCAITIWLLELGISAKENSLCDQKRAIRAFGLESRTPRQLLTWFKSEQSLSHQYYRIRGRYPRYVDSTDIS